MKEPASPPAPTVREHITLAALSAGVALAFIALWLGALSATAQASPNDPNFGHKVSLCHSTGSSSNPFVAITVDVAASGLQGGHANHAGDIIPSFTYIDNQGTSHSYPGKNLGAMYNGYSGSSVLASGCTVPTNPPVTDVCPNLDGVQEDVPDGYHLDDAGDCVEDTPPGVTDVCPNIDGDQAEVPAGYLLEGDICVADTPTEGETQTPDTTVAGESASPTSSAGTGSSSTTTTAAGELPFTGASEEGIFLLGILLTVVGLMLVRHGQRRSLDS